MTAQATIPLAPKSSIGPYRCEAVLGRGAHGVVYRAHHRNHPHVPIALKVIESRGSLDKLLLEPAILAQLDHPGIIHLRDYFLDQDRVVLALEYIDGMDLQTYVEQCRRLPPAEVRDFLGQLASALDYAHQHQILHRDIKPSNILVQNQDGRVRFVLVDFGVSRIAGGIQLQRRVGGTFHFMAPEQLRGRAAKQSDLWGLGVAAYLLLSGELPFGGSTLGEVTRNVIYKEPRSPSQLAGVSDPGLDAIIFRLLEKQVERRTDSARELLDDLGISTQLARGRSAPAVSSTDRGADRSSWEIAAERSVGRSGMLATLFLTLCVLNRIGEVIFLPVFLVPMLLLLIAAPLITHQYLKGKHLEREILLWRFFRAESGHSTLVLATLRSYLDSHPYDLVVYQRYVQALLDTGDARQAAAEARIMLNIDPHNMAGSLLLAHSYFELGLYQLATRVCDNYLAVSGYCFEFTDLKERCTRLDAGT